VNLEQLIWGSAAADAVLRDLHIAEHHIKPEARGVLQPMVRDTCIAYTSCLFVRRCQRSHAVRGANHERGSNAELKRQMLLRQTSASRCALPHRRACATPCCSKACPSRQTLLS
jgi:hypothetical protein